MKAKPAWEATPFEDRAAIFLRACELLTGKYRSEMVVATITGQGRNIWQAEIDAPPRRRPTSFATTFKKPGLSTPSSPKFTPRGTGTNWNTARWKVSHTLLRLSTSLLWELLWLGLQLFSETSLSGSRRTMRCILAGCFTTS